jgi:HSP20 family molecular chaperone IbpA
MFPVLVPTTRPTSREALDKVIEKLDSVFRDVRGKAFESFLMRGEKFGSDLEDWFKAERELFRLPESEMKETETNFEIRAAVPGFTAEDLHVQVLPELVVIEGKLERKSQETEPNKQKTEEPKSNEKIVFSEFGSKRLFRQYRMSTPIDVNGVQAMLDKGMLVITAPKQQSRQKPDAVQIPIRSESTEAQPAAMAAKAGNRN